MKKSGQRGSEGVDLTAVCQPSGQGKPARTQEDRQRRIDAIRSAYLRRVRDYEPGDDYAIIAARGFIRGVKF